MSGGSERWTQEQTAEVERSFRELAEHPPDSEERQAVRSRIVELHLPLLNYLARRYAGRAESQEDLVQVGAVGLLKAIDRFDPTLGNPFVRYAAPTVVGEMKRHLRDTGWMVRVPRRAQELHASVATTREELSQQLGRTPTVAEIAEVLEVSTEAVAETLDVARARTNTTLDAVGDSEDRLSVLDTFADDEPGFTRAEDRAVLEGAMSELTAQERTVVALRFGQGKTQSEIGAVIGVSQMQVSRLLSRSLAKMRARIGDASVMKG